MGDVSIERKPANRLGRSERSIDQNGGNDNVTMDDGIDDGIDDDIDGVIDLNDILLSFIFLSISVDFR